MAAIIVFSFDVIGLGPEDFRWENLAVVVHRKTLLYLVLLHAPLDGHGSGPPMIMRMRIDFS